MTGGVGTSTEHERSWPLRDVGQEYLRRGWFPIPLPAGQKSPPPVGWTGYTGAYADGAQVFEWGEDPRRPHANIGLRLSDDVLMLDVDAYGAKQGAETFARMSAELGPLPRAPRLTSRDDGVSCMRPFRVPPGRRWADALGPDVEVIHYGHRYAVTAPSEHPDTGKPYRWLDSDGIRELAEIPRVADLNDLPPAWVTFLDRGEIGERTERTVMLEADVAAWLTQHGGGSPCAYLTRLVDDLEAALTRDEYRAELAREREARKISGRHDATRQQIGRIVRGADQGHAGALVALDTAEALLRAQRDLGDPLEVARMISGAVGFCVAKPTPLMDRGCCPPEIVVGALEPTAFSAEPGTESSTEAADAAFEAANEAEAEFARAVAAEALKIKIRQTAQEKVAAERAKDLELPRLISLREFLAQPDDEALYRIESLMPRGGRTVLTARKKAGKTTLTGNLMRCLADGDHFLDRFAVERASRIALIDNELNERMLRGWLRAHGTESDDRIDLVSLRGRLGLFNILDRATRSRWAEEIGPADMVILDCLRPAMDALGLSEDKEAGRFLEALDELIAEAEIAEAVVIHHMGHTAERSRGDSRILDWPDAVWSVVREKRPDEEEDFSGPRYFSAYGRDVEQPEALLSYDPVTRRLSLTGGSRKQAKAEPVIAAVVDWIGAQDGQPSGNQIEKALTAEHGRDNVRAALKEAERRGLVGWRSGGTNAQLWYVKPSSREFAGSSLAGSPASSRALYIARTRSHTHAEEFAGDDSSRTQADSEESADFAFDPDAEAAARLLEEVLGAEEITEHAAPPTTQPDTEAGTVPGPNPEE